MNRLRYLEGVTTLVLDREKCNGCRMCEIVCPHAVIYIADKKAVIGDPGACMECGACALNCPTAALRVKSGAGCATAIVMDSLKKKSDRGSACSSCGCSQ